MSELKLAKQNKLRRQARVRKTTKGTEVRPRLSIHISNLHISAQIINDDTHQTLAAATTVGAKLTGKTMSEKAAIIGAEVAGKAKKAKVKTVVFDRGGNRYHGRVKALADAARQEGLDF
ncbi:50S ribosomal protein L18 [Candidatus Saccharibacteria bacterium]|jgi:large subunit ribosomal protein L18|nr:MAG: 50S ribosomal protein L18 [Candidatus Saccharibacteria bacterium]